MEDKNYEIVVGAASNVNKYSTHFDKNFNVDGSPSSVDLEDIFKAPQDNIEDIVGYAKYCYRKHGIIMRTVNITRDFGATELKLSYPSKNKNVKTIINEYNKRVKMGQLLRDFIFELGLTGNLVCYDRDGVCVDIYPITDVEPLPLIVNGKQMLGYKIDQANYIDSGYGATIDKQISSAYPKEVVQAMKNGKDKVLLDSAKAHFAKINCSAYESYGISFLVPAFEDLAHKNLLKEADKATANQVIDKIMLIKVGDENNKPNKDIINDYTTLLDGLSGSVRLTVPFYVNAEFIEPETSIFNSEKFIEIDKDILNTLGISLSLIRGESGGNYSEGIINFTGLIKTIHSIREPIVDIIENLYKAELKRHGIKPELAPSVEFDDIVIDENAKLELVKELFTTAGLPYRVLFEEYGYDFDHIKLIREEENEQDMEEIFKTHTLPFSGNQFNNQDDDKQDGQPKKNLSERKTDKTATNDNPRTNMSVKKVNNSAK